MDYFYAKKMLLDEYVANGGKNIRDFVSGMTYFQNFIENEKEPEWLNNDVVMALVQNEEIKKLQQKVEKLESAIKEKNNVIKNFRNMNKQERKEWKMSQGYKDIEKTYIRMLSELKNAYELKSKID